MKKGIISLVVFIFLLTGVGNMAFAEETSFSDLSTTHWAYQDILAMSRLGLVVGSNGQFHADQTITRAEFTAILARISELEDHPPSFADSRNHWASMVIGGAEQAGIIDQSEYGDYFQPDQPITRREMAKMIALAFAQKDEFKSLLTTFKELYYMDFPFVDAKEIKEKDIPYIALAFGTGIIAGDTQARFNLANNATRAEATAMLHRFLLNQDKSPQAFLGLMELKEVAETGTNVTTISPLIPEHEQYNGLTFDHPYYTITFKRFYVLPLQGSNKSIFERRFYWDRNSMPKHYLNLDGIIAAVAEFEFKKSGSMYHLVSTPLAGWTSFYYKEPSEKFDFMFPSMAEQPSFQAGDTAETVLYKYYELGSVSSILFDSTDRHWIRIFDK